MPGLGGRSFFLEVCASELGGGGGGVDVGRILVRGNVCPR